MTDPCAKCPLKPTKPYSPCCLCARRALRRVAKLERLIVAFNDERLDSDGTAAAFEQLVAEAARIAKRRPK